MIPPAADAEHTSKGEREIFELLKNAPGTDDWIVLHSLDLAHHTCRISGEIDFLIILPGKGILVLEVKGCSKLERHNGLWFYGVDPSPDKRGPFKQASEAMHSIRKSLSGKSPLLSNVLFWSAVAFPYIHFKCASEEWHDWQVIDRETLQSESIHDIIVNLLEQARNHINTSGLASALRCNLDGPTPQQCVDILKILRGDFEIFESPESRRNRQATELKRFTEEQFATLPWSSTIG